VSNEKDNGYLKQWAIGVDKRLRAAQNSSVKNKGVEEKESKFSDLSGSEVWDSSERRKYLD